MNLRDLNYLVTLSETQHFGQAAERCFVSQPTLSMQLKKLEQELGIALIERTTKPVLLTHAGKQVVSKAKQILQLANEIKQTSKLAQDPFSATLQLSLIPTIGPYLLPKILAPIKKQLPKLQLMLHEEKTNDALVKLYNGELDAAIMAKPIDTTNLQTRLLYKEPFLIALPKGHPLSKKSQLSLKDIDSEQLLLLSDGHCLRDQALEACQLSNRSDFFEATSLETLRYMVASGTGITLLPELATQANHPLITLKPFKKPVPYREVILVWRQGSTLTPCFERIAKLIGSLF